MIQSYNEWSQLKTVVVGDASWANWPSTDPVFAKESEKTTWTQSPVPSGSVPAQIIHEANQDLEILCNTLRDMGVTVFRPTPLDFQNLGGMYNYCPRDRLLIYGSKVIDTAMMYPCRDMELSCYQHVLADADVVHMPRDQAMVLDAANICRLGDKMLFLESPSGNRAAYNWLCAQFPDTEIELCNFYSGVHIDSTIVPLREGLVMLNASRVKFDSVPKVFDGWHKIWIGDVTPRDFYQYPFASKWIGMNLLVVDPNTVIVDRQQTELIKTLKSYQFEVVPLELRHSRTLGGGFHCVTLDLERKHS